MVAHRLRVAPVSIPNDPSHPFVLYPQCKIATQSEDDLGLWSQATPVSASGDDDTLGHLASTGRILFAEGLEQVEVEGESRAHPGVYWVKVLGTGVHQGVTGWVGGAAITLAGKDGPEAFPFVAKNQIYNGSLPIEALRQR